MEQELDIVKTAIVGNLKILFDKYFKRYNILMKNFFKEHWWVLWTGLYYLPVGFYVMMKYNGGMFEKHLLIVQAIWLFPMFVYFLYLVFNPILKGVDCE